MWPWLQAWLAFTLGCIWAMVIYFTATQIVFYGQPKFTADERYHLTRIYPGGSFPNDRTYKFCDGAEWIYVDAEWNKSSTHRACIKPPE